MTSVVIEDPDADRYTEVLSGHFPDVRFAGFRSTGDMLAHLDELRTAEVLMTKGGSMRPGITEELPDLRWVQSLIAGVDRFVGVLAARPGILLTSTRGMHGPQMAEMALTQMLVLARDVQRTVRNRQRRAWERWEPLLLRGKFVGVVGLGVSGQEVGRLCKALGMHVIGISRTTAARSHFDEVYGYDSIAQIASKVDFLILTVPYRPETERLIDSTVLSAMKQTAFLINIARGGIVDDQALVRALETGGIAGAALDVFRTEPLPDSSPFWDLPNVFLTPHVAGMSEHYVEQALRIIRPNLDAYLSGQPDSMVNRIDYGRAAEDRAAEDKSQQSGFR